MNKTLLKGNEMTNDKQPDMRELIERGRKAAVNIAAQGIYGWGNTMTDLCDALEASLQQVSEAGAVAEVIDNKPYWILEAMPVFLSNGTKLYLAPPSAPAIETAAYMRAAEVCEKLRASIIPCDQFESGKQDSAYVLKHRIHALVPQDGRTQLEEFGWKLAQAILEARREGLLDGSDIRAIVTNLIGVPPLSSETSGEGKK
jgi:hypothetical protein